MSKQSGIGAALLVGQFDLSGDIGSVQTCSCPRTVLDLTTIAQPAFERALALRSGEISFTSFWDIAAGRAHPALSALPTTDRIVTFASATTLGADAASMAAKQINYDPTRGADGSLTATVQMLANGGTGLDWGNLLTTGAQTIASAAATTSIDDYGGTSTAFGAAAYLHVLSLGSGSATVTVQDSANNSAFTNLTGMAFTAVSGATSERIQGAVNATVRRYIRLNITGTFTNLVCAVVFARYLADPSI